MPSRSGQAPDQGGYRRVDVDNVEALFLQPLAEPSIRAPVLTQLHRTRYRQVDAAKAPLAQGLHMHRLGAGGRHIEAFLLKAEAERGEKFIEGKIDGAELKDGRSHGIAISRRILRRVF